MPLEPGSSREAVGQNIKELHHGSTYKHTKGKFGEEKANQQAIAIALKKAGLSNKQK
jgi:hypothetical protein